MNQTHTEIIGTNINTTAEFKDFGGKKVIPNIVKLNYKKPDASIVSLDISPVNNIFSANVPLDLPGEWFFRWECFGTHASAEEFKVVVIDTKVK